MMPYRRFNMHRKRYFSDLRDENFLYFRSNSQCCLSLVVFAYLGKDKPHRGLQIFDTRVDFPVPAQSRGRFLYSPTSDRVFFSCIYGRICCLSLVVFTCLGKDNFAWVSTLWRHISNNEVASWLTLVSKICNIHDSASLVGTANLWHSDGFTCPYTKLWWIPIVYLNICLGKYIF